MIRFLYKFLICFCVLQLFVCCINETTKSYDSQLDVLTVWAQQNGYNDQYAFLIDYSIHSGKKRGFLYSIPSRQVKRTFLVAHGGGCGSSNGKPERFSNVPESRCSSEGIAILGNRDWSNWGIHVKYWLEGLEATNNQMRNRVVVLHSWEGIPDVETYPLPIATSDGCPTVSNKTMKFIDSLVQAQTNKKILFYQFD